MGKIDTLNGYIEECDKAIDSCKYPSSLVKKIAYTYYEELGLTNNPLSPKFDSNPTEDDILLLMALLTDYRDNIEMNEEREKREIERLKLEKSRAAPPISITNTSNSASTSSANATVTISIANTLERLQALPDTTFSQEDKDALEEKLAALQVALDNRDNDKAKLKLTNVLKYIGDKCVDAGIAVLPYLGQVATTI